MPEPDTIPTPQTVLCPLDGAPDAERAVATATQMTALFGAELVLFNAVADHHEAALAHTYLTGHRDAIMLAHPDLSVAITAWRWTRTRRRRSHRGSTRRRWRSWPHRRSRFCITATSGRRRKRSMRESHRPIMLIGPHASGQTDVRDLDRVIVPVDGSVAFGSGAPR